LFGLYNLPVGLLTIIIYLSNGNSDDSGFWIFEFSIAIASFLAPALLWYVIIERKKRLSIKRGIVVGVLSTVLSHFFNWYFFLLIGYVSFMIVGPEGTFSGNDPINPLFAIIAALTYSTVSLFLFGILHLPIRGLIGDMFARKFQHEL
jgi:hypothetical protein